MKPLLFRMDGKDVHRNAEFRLRFPEDSRSKREQMIVAVFSNILSNYKCGSKVNLDVSRLTKAEMHRMRAAIQSHDPYHEWETEVMSALDYYKAMTNRQRQVFLLIPFYKDAEIASKLSMSFHHEREVRKEIYDLTDCHSKDEVAVLVRELQEAGEVSF